jgi:hypothetical protein
MTLEIISGVFYFKIINKNKMNKVTVAADKNGNVIGISPNNPEYGWIRVEQNARVITERGWLRNSKRSALIKGKVEDLVASNYRDGEEITGRIIVVESHDPFNPENPDRDLKIAGTTGIICRVDDQPIFRQTFFTPNTNAEDELIMHNNSEEIREVQQAQRSYSVMGKSILDNIEADL